jgi:hypothetical protein
MSVAYPIIITKKNLVPGTTNTFEYRFSNNVDFSQLDIGLSQASIFHSWFNITAQKSNNQFSIIHPIAGTANTTLNFTIPDGGYEIADLNNFLRYSLVSAGYYLTNNTTGEQVVYCEFKVNPSVYKVEFISYPLPTSLPSGFTAGPALVFPSNTRTPQLSFTQPAFGDIIGFIQGTYPSPQPTVLTTSSSIYTPIVSDVQNVVLTLNSCMNPFAPNSSIIYSVSPAGVPFGRLITDKPNEICWVPQQSSFRQSIVLQLTNQDLQPIELQDTDITVILLIRFRDQNVMNR